MSTLTHLHWEQQEFEKSLKIQVKAACGALWVSSMKDALLPLEAKMFRLGFKSLDVIDLYIQVANQILYYYDVIDTLYDENVWKEN